MPNSVYTYDPKKVIVTIGGQTISGFQKGAFIDVKPAADRYSKHVGADGELTRVANADHTHEIKLVLQQSSPSNDYLSSLIAADAKSNDGIVACSIVDVNGTTNLVWAAAWVKVPPNISNSDDLSPRDWIFDTAQVQKEFYGGNLGQ